MFYIKKILTFVRGKNKGLPVYKFFEQVTPTEFKVILNSVKPRNTILGYTMPNITELPYEDVMSFIEAFNDYTPFEVVSEFLKMQDYEVSDAKLLKMKAGKFLGFTRHLRDEVEKVANLLIGLKTEPDAKLINAGIEELDKYKTANVYYSICKDPNEWDRLEKTPFKKMFVKLMMDKDNAEINRKYNEILSKD